MSSYQVSDAKLGFELETAAIQFEFDGQDPGKPKGQLVEFSGPNPATGQDGPLPQLSLLPPPNYQEGSAILVSTAEIGSRLSSVRIEFIFGYQKGAFFGETSQNMSLQAGNKIVEVMTKWAKFPQPKSITMRVGLEHKLPAPNAPPWRCRLPTTPLSQLPLGQDFGSQMTAAFPLAAVPQLLLEERSLVLTGGVSQKFLAIKTASIEEALNTSWGAQWRTDIWRGNISPEYGCNSMLGFLILVQSYVQVATPEASSGDNDLKLKTPIMPRTDFRTMLRLVTDLMTPESAAAFATAPPQSLPMLMLVMSKLNAELKTKNWFWNRANGTELRLPVVEWLQGLCAQPGKDQIAINDRLARNAQIGGLGNKVERMIGKEDKENVPLCPILEFRDLGSLKWTQVTSQAPAIFENPESVNYEGGTSILQTLEQWVRDHHSKALSSYSRESTPAATKATGPQIAVPAPGFIPQMASNAAGFAFRQLMGGQTSGASSRRPAPPPPPTIQNSNPRPPPPPPPASSQTPISRPPPPLAGQTSGASSRRPAPPPPPTIQNSNSRPPPPPPPASSQTPISRPPPSLAGQPTNAQAMPHPTSQVRQPPVVPARVPGPVKVPPTVPARGPTNK